MKPVRKRPDFGTMTCADCGTTAKKSGPVQRYCPSCSQLRDLERKKKHAQSAYVKSVEDAKRAHFADRGAQLNLVERLDLQSSIPPMPPMAWYKRVELPFSWAGSKNHIFASTQRGHVFMRAESRGMRSELTALVFEAMRGVSLVQNKLWLDIYVQKPAQRGDAVNFVDMVCDAAKDAMPLDDRWFSLRVVDWQIVKTEPKLFVGFGQEQGAVNVQACSSCGRLLTFDNFQRNKARRHGIGLNCRDCQAEKPRSLKRDNARLQMAVDFGVGVFG